MVAERTPVETSNGDLVRSWMQIINRADIESLKKVWTADTIARFPDRTCHGADAIAEYFSGLFNGLPDFRMEPVSIVDQGEDVYLHWLLTGHHTGEPIQGYEPSGHAIALDGMEHFVIRDGVVVTVFVIYDQLQFAHQIGAFPPKGSPPDRAAKAAFNARTRLVRRLHR